MKCTLFYVPQVVSNVKVLENGIWTKAIVSNFQFHKSSSLRVFLFIKAQIHQIQYELEPYKCRIRCAFSVEYKMNFPTKINLNSLIQTVCCLCMHLKRNESWNFSFKIASLISIEIFLTFWSEIVLLFKELNILYSIHWFSH